MYKSWPVALRMWRIGKTRQGKLQLRLETQVATDGNTFSVRIAKQRQINYLPFLIPSVFDGGMHDLDGLMDDLDRRFRMDMYMFNVFYVVHWSAVSNTKSKRQCT